MQAMSGKKRVEGQQVFGEADVAEILERAIRLDGARDSRVTVDQLREAALEVGVSPAAFAEALEAFGRERSPAEDSPDEPVAPPSRFRGPIRTALSLAFGATLGTVAGVVDGPFLNEETWALSAILLAGASLRLVLSHRRDKALLPYIVDVIWLWSSFAAAVALITNFLPEESIIGTVVGIVLASVVGGAIMKSTRREEPHEPVRTLRLELAAPKDDRDE